MDDKQQLKNILHDMSFEGDHGVTLNSSACTLLLPCCAIEYVGDDDGLVKLKLTSIFDIYSELGYNHTDYEYLYSELKSLTTPMYRPLIVKSPATFQVIKGAYRLPVQFSVLGFFDRWNDDLDRIYLNITMQSICPIGDKL